MLFLVLLLSVTASSYRSLDHLLSPRKLFRNPRKFVNAFSQANPATIDTLIEKIDDLIKEGEDDVKSAQDQHTAALNLLNEEAKKLETATKDEETKAQNHVDSQDELKKANDAVADGHKKVIFAETDKDSKQDSLDLATKNRDAVVKRTSAEADDYAEILALLDELEPSQEGAGRRLLEAVLEAGEDDVTRMRGYVETMKTQSEHDAADAEREYNEHKGESEAANKKYQDLVDQQVDLEEAQEAAQNKFDVAKAEHEAAEVALAKVTKSHEEAKIAEGNAKEFLDSETKRVTDDNNTLNEVKKLLGELKKSE